VFPDERHYADKMEDGVGKVMLPHKTERKCIQNFDGENRNGRDYLEDHYLHERIFLKWILTFWRRNYFFYFSTSCI